MTVLHPRERIDLKDCPHCGGRAEFRDGSSTKPYIRCSGCGCRTHGSFDLKKLAAIWNMRVDDRHDLTCELEPTASERTDAPVRVFECDCCGKSCDVVYAEDYVYCPYCGRLNTAREVEVEE